MMIKICQKNVAFIEVLHYNISVMKYFIDFEATQFSGDIISVGCVDEMGRRFYSLVKPHKLGLMTGFITDLTGITMDDIRSAPTVNEAFAEFYDWIDKTGRADFYVYGNSDAHFIKTTLQYVTEVKAQFALSLILGALHDYSYKLADHFGITQPVSLLRSAEYYSGKRILQKHNSLEDSLLLKYVYEKSQRDVITECPFPEYKRKDEDPAESKRQAKPKILIKAIGEEDAKTFYSYRKAAEWVMKDLMPEDEPSDEKTKSNVCNRIVKSAKHFKPYCGYKWYIETN